MDREILAAHLALVGGIAVRYTSSCVDYALFLPGHRCWWAGESPSLRSNEALDAGIIEEWRGHEIHPRDIPDPYYDKVVALAIQEGAL